MSEWMKSQFKPDLWLGLKFRRESSISSHLFLGFLCGIEDALENTAENDGSHVPWNRSIYSHKQFPGPHSASPWGLAHRVPEAWLHFSQENWMIHQIFTPENCPAHFISCGMTNKMGVWMFSRAPGCQRAGSREALESAGLVRRWQVQFRERPQSHPVYLLALEKEKKVEISIQEEHWWWAACREQRKEDLERTLGLQACRQARDTWPKVRRELFWQVRFVA